MEEQTHKQTLLNIYKKNLWKVELQVAQYGQDIPIKLLNDIDFYKAKIEELEQSINNKTLDTTYTIAGITLCQSTSSVFVDLMRLLCMLSSKLAFEANVIRYTEFIRIAENHFGDLRSLFARYTTTMHADDQQQSILIERRLSWLLTQLPSPPHLLINPDRYFIVMRNLAATINEFFLSVAKDYYERQKAFVELTNTEQISHFGADASLSNYDKFILRRHKIQSIVLERYSQDKAPVYSIGDDVDQVVSILYYLIDISLLQDV